MPDFNRFINWGGKTGIWIGDIERDAVTDFVLGYHSISIQFLRQGTLLGAQAVLIAGSSQGTVQGETGRSGENKLYLIGATDLDIRAGDQFTYQNVIYQVKTVMTHIDGRIKALIQGLD
jgi:hypothetical protein